MRAAVIFVGPVLAASGFVDGYPYSPARTVKLQETPDAHTAAT